MAEEIKRAAQDIPRLATKTYEHILTARPGRDSPDEFHSKGHDFLTIGAAGCSVWKRRDSNVIVPTAAYCIMTDVSDFGFTDDHSFVRHRIENVGVAALPDRNFLPILTLAQH